MEQSTIFLSLISVGTLLVYQKEYRNYRERGFTISESLYLSALFILFMIMPKLILLTIIFIISSRYL